MHMKSVFPRPLLRMLLFLLLLTAVLSACAASTPPPTPLEPSQPVQAATPVPSSTPMPTATALPTFTPTLAPTVEPSATVAPTADSALSQVKLVGLGWREDYSLFVTLQFPQPINPDHYKVTLENKPYTCIVTPQSDKRLYCWGQGAKVLGVATVRVYPAGSDQPGFEKEVWVPYFTFEH